MALIRWEPVSVNRLFNTFFDTPTTGGPAPLRRWIPAIDVVENESDYVLKADLPGLAREDISIEFENDVLTVAGERRSEHEQHNGGYYRLERSSGAFRRSLRLPEGVDPEALTASFENGVLEVHVPKPAHRAPRKVAIAIGGGEPAPAGSDVETAGAEAGAAAVAEAPEQQAA